MKSFANKESILLVLPWDPMLPGGVSIVVRNLARVWRNAGIANTILISDWKDERPRTLPTGTHKLRLAIFGEFSAQGIVKALVSTPRTLLRTHRMLKEAAVTGVCFHYPSIDALGTLILKQLGLFRGRVALCFHGTDVRIPANKLEAMLWRWMFAHADGITVCSRSLAADVHNVFGVAENRINVVYNGVDTDMFTPLRETESFKPILEGKYIVSVGSFIARKGHRFLLEAYAQIAQAHPQIGLVIVGGDGDERVAMQAWIDERALGARIKLLVGLAPTAVAEVVKAAAMCVQPSIAEPFGMAVIEAGACGVLVAASAVGGHVELIEHEKTGLLFPVAEANALASLLEAYLSNPAQFEELAHLFRAQILKRFTWESCAAQYNAVISDKFTTGND